MKNLGVFLTFLMFAVFFVGCENHDFGEGRATVIVEETADIACGLPVIRFLTAPDGSAPADFSGSEVFTAFNLESSLIVEGAELIITFDEVPAEKLQPCLAVGTWYQSIWITSARRIK
jgi:hypothetical protein